MEYFLDGLKIAQLYVAEYGELNPAPLQMYHEFCLSVWVNTFRNSISIGTLSDERIDLLQESGLNLGLKPMKQNEWYLLGKKWFENN